jgi:hypothetical protein
LSKLRRFLEEKANSGVAQVRVRTVLAMLDEELKARRGGAKNGRVTISPDDLLGAAEVAELLRVDRTRPSKWMMTKKPDGSPKPPTTFGPDKVPFPQPFAKPQSGPIWLRSQVEPFIPWVEERRRHGARD